MQNLQIFNNKEFGEIRVIEKDNEPWFVAKEIASALEFSSTWAMTKGLDDDEKDATLSSTLGGNQSMTIINESGLYSAILRSRKKEAKKFKRWVTSEILPSIRKHGAYLTDEKLEEVLTNPDTIIKLATQLKEERREKELLRLNNEKQNQIIGELKPKADYTDRILQNKGLVTITQIAKDYGMSGQAMNKLLHDLGVQYKQSGQWLLYKKHHGKGYTHSNTVEIPKSDGTIHIAMNTKWTQKGRLFLYELLKENYILPIIETAFEEIATTKEVL